MSSLVPMTAIRYVALTALIGTFAAIAVMTLIALLVLREISRALNPRLSRLIDVLAVVIPPLLLVFIAIAAVRLRVNL